MGVAGALALDHRPVLVTVPERPLPAHAPGRGAFGQYAGHANRQAAVGQRLDTRTANESQTAMVEVVGVEVVDLNRQAAGVHERVEVFVLKPQVGIRKGLEAVVAANHPPAGARIVGLANTRQQHQAHIVELVGGDDDDVGRLLAAHAVLVDIADAGCGFAIRRLVDMQDFGFG
ncbi:hypothetical protein D3C76_1125810 [compost metagenome]